MRCLLRRHAEGQMLIVMAIALPVVIALVLAAVEIGVRMLQRAEVEDALQQATRAAIQMFDYQAFAENRQAIRQEEVIAVARSTFTANLSQVSGLAPGQTPKRVAHKVKWKVLLNGGTCTFDSADPGDDMSFATPALCAELDAPLAGTVFKGRWTPKIRAAATIDRFP